MTKNFKAIIIALLLVNLLSAYSLTPKNFNSSIASNKVVVVEYWAPWCTPCKVMKPEYKKASQQLQGKVLWAKYNVDLGGDKR